MANEKREMEVSDLEFDDLALDDIIADEDEEDGNVKCLPPAQAGGGVEKSKRITTPYLTKYERARVLGEYDFKLFLSDFFV